MAHEQQDVNELLRSMAQRLDELEEDPDRGKRAVLDLDEDVKKQVPPHCQWTPLPRDERRRIVAHIPRFNVQVPQPLKDHNGLAFGHGFSKEAKELLNNTVPAFQAQAIEAMRAAAHARQIVAEAAESQDRDELVQAVDSCLRLCADNVVQLGRYQLAQVLKGRGQQGAETLMQPQNRAADDPNIFTDLHVDAISKLAEFRSKSEPRPRVFQPYSSPGASRGRYRRGSWSSRVQRAQRGRGFYGPAPKPKNR